MQDPYKMMFMIVVFVYLGPSFFGKRQILKTPPWEGTLGSCSNDECGWVLTALAATKPKAMLAARR